MINYRLWTLRFNPKHVFGARKQPILYFENVTVEELSTPPEFVSFCGAVWRMNDYDANGKVADYEPLAVVDLDRYFK